MLNSYTVAEQNKSDNVQCKAVLVGLYITCLTIIHHSSIQSEYTEGVFIGWFHVPF